MVCRARGAASLRRMRAGWRTYAAELLGTFVLVFGGTTSVVAAGRTSGPLLVIVPLAFGLALLAGLYAFGEVSGGHFNPAVSLAMFLDRRLAAGDLVGYWLAQLAGGVLGSVGLLIATSKHEVAATATRPFAGNGTAFFIELVLTAVFVLVILQASRSEAFGASALIAIPLALVVVHICAIPFSGCGVNPARSFGPALVGNTWTGFWIYVLAPLLGAAAAWAIHTGVVRGALAPAAAVAEVLQEPATSDRPLPG
jgi:aquaporin Z